MKFELRIRRMDKYSILIDWPQRIDEHILFDILHFKVILSKYYADHIKNITNAYASILLDFKNEILFDKEQSSILQLYSTGFTNFELKTKCWHIPVCYDESFCLDLSVFKAKKGIGHSQLIETHTKSIYRVYMIGFLPGFPYLGGLDSRLYCPRRSEPRKKIEKGSVAIGGQQTGIYTQDSPGGWHIIGKTPLDIFDLNREEPCAIRAGDQVKFYPINEQMYFKLKDL